MATSIRTATKAALVTTLTAGLLAVQVTYGFPGDLLERECVYVGRARGPYDIPVMRAGRKARQDEFTIDLWIIAGAPNQTAREAEERAEDMLAVIEDALANDPQLGATVTGLLHLTLGEVEGPDCDPTVDGYVGVIRVEIEASARLS